MWNHQIISIWIQHIEIFELPFFSNAGRYFVIPSKPLYYYYPRMTWWNTIEPQHDKTNKLSVRPAKTQINLGIRPVWSEYLLCAQWIAKAFFMWTAKTLIRLGGCPGWSESSLGAHAILLVCREAAQLTISISYGVSTESDIQHSFSERHYVMTFILVPGAAEFPNCVAIWHPKSLIKCSVGQFGKKYFRAAEVFMSLNLQFLRILFCENDKWHLGRLRHCCVTLNLRIDSCIDKCILFLEEMKIWNS